MEKYFARLQSFPSPHPGNLFQLDNIKGHSYDLQKKFFEGYLALPEGLGWFIVVGLGFVFCLLTSVLVYFDYHYGGTKHTSEQFNSAGRSIKTGLIACDIVSKWTWAATLLQSSNVAYKLGVSGPFWYAAGATIQVLLFAVLAIEIKRKAPTAHTFLEIILQRWGTTAHIVFLFFAFVTNIIVTSMLILGGAAVTNALTGINIYAAAFLIPISVVVYTAHGGLKATFIASWAHVAIIYIALCIFIFLVYAGNSDLGSISKVYDHLHVVADVYWKDYKTHGKARANYLPLEDNKGHSYLTILSQGGFIFGIINIIGNFGTVFVDQAYWQSAIAAKPAATYKGYILGGLCWFAIPFTMATTMGLGARALDLPITIDESNSGLVPPALAVHMLGKGGGFLLVLQLFMAVTASASAEQIAVSSLVAYDIYRTYMNPKATGKQIIKISRIFIVVYGVLSGVFAIILQKMGLNLGWVYEFMGVVIGSAVAPVALSITWKGCSAIGAIAGAIGGLIAAVIAWLVRAKVEGGEVTIDTTFLDYAMLSGNLVAIVGSLLICVVISLFTYQNYDFEDLKNIPMVERDGSEEFAEEGEDSLEGMHKALRFTWFVGGGLAIVLIVLWPALAVPAGVFTKGYFTMWVTIAMIWGLAAAFCAVVLPIFEARETIVMILKSLISNKSHEDTTNYEEDKVADLDAKGVELTGDGAKI